MDVAYLTNKGRVYDHNEDSVYVSGKTLPLVAVVADGIGGHVAGSVASSMTVEYIQNRLRDIDSSALTDEELKELSKDASQNLLDAEDLNPSLKDMGTTLVLAIVTDGKARVLNVGDSRAYMIREGKLKRITKDHSFVQYLVDNNVLTEEEAERHPYRNRITRAIGIEGVEGDVYEVPFSGGDRLLLCSDGLTAHLRDADIAYILSQNNSSRKKSERLISTALERGGTDNVSVIVIENTSMVGKVLQNRYHIIEEIAEGGMSHVYAARCRKTGDKVAIKMFKEELMNTPEAVDGFKREAYICSRLHHRNIVHTIDVGRHDKLKYIVMEYIEGISLRQLMDRGIWDIEYCRDIAVSILDALAYSHARGVIHKDLKPQNIIIRKGEPVLIDFGIAEDVSDKDYDVNTVLGTIDYFSPEQAVGEKLDNRTDIYSVGIMLYEMVTGKVPFSGPDNVSIALKHLHQPAVPPVNLNPDIPESLNKIILKAISKEKKDRYANAAAMAQDLRRAFLEPDGAYVITEDEIRAREEKKRAAGVKRLIIGLSASVATLVVIIGLIVAFITNRNNAAAPTAYMPYLLESNLESATEMLNEMDVNVEVITQYDVRLDYDEDMVVEQSPAEGTVLSDGDTVTITVSSLTLKGGIMPNVLGMTERQALKAIEEAKIEAPTVLYQKGNVHDRVFDQSPAEGETVLGPVVIYVYD